MAEAFVDYAKAFGWTEVSHKWTLHNDGFIMVGLLELSSKKILEEINLPPELSPKICLGIINRHDQKAALKVVIGGEVFVCSNGLVIGKLSQKKRHTIGFDLQEFVESALQQAQQEAALIGDTVNKMKAIKLTDQQALYLLFLLHAKEKLLVWNHISGIFDYWENPRYPEFRDKNLWTLYNAITSYAKILTPMTAVRIVNELHPAMQAVWKLVKS